MKKLFAIVTVILGLVIIMLLPSYPKKSTINSHKLSNFPGWQTKVATQSQNTCTQYYKGYIFVYETQSVNCQKQQNLFLFVLDVVILFILLFIIALVISLVAKKPPSKAVLHKQLDLYTVRIVGYITGLSWFFVVYAGLAAVTSKITFVYLILFAILASAIEFGLFKHWDNKGMHTSLIKVTKTTFIFGVVIISSTLLLYIGIAVYGRLHDLYGQAQELYSVTALGLLFIIVFGYILINLIKDLYKYLNKKFTGS